MRHPILIGFVTAWLKFSSATVWAEVVQVGAHRDHVLGTSLDINVYTQATDRAATEKIIAAGIEEIARLEKILSTYKSDSELSQLNQQRELSNASPVLLAVMHHCAQWNKHSAGKFSCRMGALKRHWQEAEKAKGIPDRVELRKLARTIARSELSIPIEQGALALPENIQIDADGLAKGYIIDHVFAFLQEKLPQASAISVDIGGDGRYWGTPSEESRWQVGVADPNQVSDNQGMLATLSIDNGAVAASGHSSRFLTIEHRQFSHILDPADGWPLFQAPSAIVLAKNALTADAVATALSTQEMSVGIDWVNSLEDVEALVVSPLGLQIASKNWSNYVKVNRELASIPFQLKIDYTIPRFKVDVYNKPYLAIWISDANNKPVRNLLLLGESERWARENTRWWRRVGRRNADLLDGIARPTRRPGKYSLQWDGRDDFGGYLARGEYTLHLEAAREHGGHNYQKFNLSLLQKPFNLQIDESDGELGAVTLSYLPKPNH